MRVFASILTTLAMCSAVTAFTSTSPAAFARTSTGLSMSSASLSKEERSDSVPFRKRNPVLDGRFPGDAQFDPLFLAENDELFFNYREAEVKHARLAMLAAAGWPISEWLNRPLANAVGAAPTVGDADRVPSILNGGLENTPRIYWVVALSFAAFIECANIQIRRNNPDTYFPGNLNFDPLGLYPKTESGQKKMQLKEIKNGRLAMIAITAFAFQEFIGNTAVIDQKPHFFEIGL